MDLQKNVEDRLAREGYTPSGPWADAGGLRVRTFTARFRVSVVAILWPSGPPRAEIYEYRRTLWVE